MVNCQRCIIIVPTTALNMMQTESWSALVLSNFLSCDGKHHPYAIAFSPRLTKNPPNRKTPLKRNHSKS